MHWRPSVRMCPLLPVAMCAISIGGCGPQAETRAGATTGAWPGVQSFCGWKSSGLTGKGGLGPYYVQQFAREQSRTIVEQ